MTRTDKVAVLVGMIIWCGAWDEHVPVWGAILMVIVGLALVIAGFMHDE